MKNSSKAVLHVIEGGPEVEALNDWLKRHQASSDILKTVDRAHALLVANPSGRVGINVVAEHKGQPVFVVGEAGTARLALYSPDGMIWMVGVKPSRKITLETFKLNVNLKVATHKDCGLPTAWLFPCYLDDDDKHRFSLHIFSPFDLMTIVWQIARHFR